MRFTIYVEIFLAVVLVIFIVMQFIVPAIRGTKILPMFRKERELKAEILNEQQADYERDLEEHRQAYVDGAGELSRREFNPYKADPLSSTGADAPVRSPELDAYWRAEKERKDRERDGK